MVSVLLEEPELHGQQRFPELYRKEAVDSLQQVVAEAVAHPLPLCYLYDFVVARVLDQLGR